jgi:hypothetical protein
VGGSPLGHVHELVKLADWLRDPDSALSASEKLDELRDLIRRSGDADRDLERQRKALATDKLARYQMWSFLVEDDPDAFTALAADRIRLVERLGLGHLKDPRLELVYWMHELGATPAFRPTVWDADLDNPYWRPTGRTEPLDGSGSAAGLPEVVHSPIEGGDLTNPISEVGR